MRLYDWTRPILDTFVCGEGYIGRAHSVFPWSLFGGGGVMVWIIRFVAGSQIPRHVLVVFKKRKNVFQQSVVRCGIVANVHCDISGSGDYLQVRQVSATFSTMCPPQRIWLLLFLGTQSPEVIEEGSSDSIQVKHGSFYFLASSFIPCCTHFLDSAACLSVASRSFSISLMRCRSGTCRPFSTAGLAIILSSHSFKCGNSSSSTPAHPAAVTHPQCAISAIVHLLPTR